jgi:hypothetical protein
MGPNLNRLEIRSHTTGHAFFVAAQHRQTRFSQAIETRQILDR